MGKIFCVMGKTASGKDTIFQKLVGYHNLKPIVLFTTRPKREQEVNGREYHFIPLEQLSALEQEGKVIEKRVYHTVKGDWYYATIDEENAIDLEHNHYIILNTLEGYQSLVRYYGEDVVVPIYLWIDLSSRLERALFREEQQVQPNYKELCRRFICDEQDFSEEKLYQAGILEEDSYPNDDLELCLFKIKRKIDTVLEDTKQHEKVKKLEQKSQG